MAPKKMAPKKKRGGVSSSPEYPTPKYPTPEYSKPKQCIYFPNDPNKDKKQQHIQNLIDENYVCKIIKNDDNAQKIITKLHEIAGYDLCGSHINLFRGSCYIGKKTIQTGGGCFSSCRPQKAEIEEPIRYNKHSLQPESLQLFYQNNGITLHNFLIQNKDDKALNFYIDGLLNIAKGIGVLQKNKYSHGSINLDNILITLEARTLDMLLINLDKAKYEDEAEPDPTDVVMLGQVIKDILENFYPLIEGNISYHIELKRHNALHKKLKTLADQMLIHEMYKRVDNIKISDVIDQLEAMYNAEISFDDSGSYPPNGSSPPKNEGSTGEDALNLYNILELTKDSSSEQIKKAYRILARFFHPDKNLGGPNQENQQNNKAYYTEKMQQINNAYKILSDSTTRKEYDAKMKQRRGGRVSRKSYRKPVNKSVHKQAKPANKSVHKPVDKPVDKPADIHAIKPSNKSVNKQAKPANKPVHKPVHKPADIHAIRPSNKSVNKQAKPANKPVHKPVKPARSANTSRP